MRGSFILSAAERHQLHTAMARARSGQSLLHPKGRPITPPEWNRSVVAQQVYPRVPHPLSSHFLDQSP